MGIYKRADSKYFWFHFPGGIKESSGIRASEDNRQLAEQAYGVREQDLARLRFGLPAVKKVFVRGSKLGGAWIYVYFISDGESVKIGRAVNVLNRIKIMQSASSRPLTLLACAFGHYTIEAQIHDLFAEHRISREWFRPAQPLMDFIAAIERGENVMTLVTRLTRLDYAGPVEREKSA